MLVNIIGESRKALGEKITKAKEFEFLRGLFGGAGLAQIIELSLNRGLPEILGVAKESEMGFDQECR